MYNNNSNRNRNNCHKYDRDHLLRLNPTLCSALHETLSLFERVITEKIMLRTLSSSSRLSEVEIVDKCNQILYSRCRSLVWTEDVQCRFFTHFRQQYQQQQQAAAAIIEQENEMRRWIADKMPEQFVDLFIKIAPTLERLSIIGLPYLYYQLCHYGFPWLQLTRILRELIIIVTGVNPYYEHMIEQAQQHDALLRLYRCSGYEYFPRNFPILQKIYICTKKSLANYGVDQYTLDTLAPLCATYVRTIAHNPYSAKLHSLQRRRKVPRFSRLQAYTVWLLDAPKEHPDQPPVTRGPIRLLNLWYNCAEILEPPSEQIRHLTVIWIGNVCGESLVKLFKKLTQFIDGNLVSLDLMFSFKSVTEFVVQRQRKLEEFVYKYNQRVHNYPWSYRSLRLAFPNHYAHNLLDKQSPIHDTGEVHLTKHTTMLAQFFLNSNAMNLRQLWLAPNCHMVPVKIDAPNICLFHLDFRYYHPMLAAGFTTLPWTSFRAASTCVRELCLYNFSSFNYTLTPSPLAKDDEDEKQHRMVEQSYRRMFHRMFYCFNSPLLTSVRLCCNESKPNIIQTHKLDDVGLNYVLETDTFYLDYYPVIVDYVRKLLLATQLPGSSSSSSSSSAFSELQLLDVYHKPIDFVLQLIEQFAECAKLFPNRSYLLLVQGYVVYVPPPPPPGGGGGGGSGYEDEVQKTLQSLTTNYQKTLDSVTNEIGNLRLVLRKKVMVYRRQYVNKSHFG